MKFTVILPTFNEEAHIEKTMHKNFELLKKYKLTPEVIVVDDSKDKTMDILKRLQKRYKSLKVFHRENKTGVGSAIRLGIEKSSGDYIIIQMSDSPEDVKYFPSIISKFEQGYDIVQTSRFMPGCKIVGYPFVKRISNLLCNRFINIAFLEFKLKDFSCLFKAFNKKKIMHLNLEADHFDLGTEIVLKAMRKKYKITEVPVNWYERKKGNSKFNLSKFAKIYLYRIMKIWLTYW